MKHGFPERCGDTNDAAKRRKSREDTKVPTDPDPEDAMTTHEPLGRDPKTP